MRGDAVLHGGSVFFDPAPEYAPEASWFLGVIAKALGYAFSGAYIGASADHPLRVRNRLRRLKENILTTGSYSLSTYDIYELEGEQSC